MGNNLATKVAIIVAVLLVFVFGIIGPYGADSHLTDSPMQNLAKNIHLGLDLKGGTHLVLEVHVKESANLDNRRRTWRGWRASCRPADCVRQRSTSPMRAHPETIAIAGITATQSGQVRTIVDSNEYAAYDVAGQPDGSIKLTMKPGSIKDLYSRTLATSIEVIRQRVDVLGVSEPTIQQYGLGDNQILVELPG